MSGTTTLKQLQDTYRRSLYNTIPIEPINEDPNDPTRGMNALERALRSLETGEINALASDALIVQSFLEEGVKGGGEEGKMSFVKRRDPYKDLRPGFAVFPSKQFTSPDKSDYLPRTDNEFYAMAVRAGTSNTNELRRLIDDTLGDLNQPETELKKAQDELIAKDSLKGIPEVGEGSGPNPPVGDAWWKSPSIVAALIAAAASIIVATMNPQIIGGIFRFIGAFISSVISSMNGVSRVSSTHKTITGRILNASTGAWIVGARVSLETDGTPPPVEYTDSEGIFEFSLQRVTNRVRIRVDANGFETFDRRINLANARVIEDIRLLPKS